jgi:hypothetical protein
MNRIAVLLTSMVVALALTIGAAGAQDAGMIAGSGAGAFPGGAAFAGIPVSALEFGQGVLTAADGSAVGAFHAVLRGPLQLVSVDGVVSTGAVAGTASFGGTATVSLGDGSLPLSGVPFQVALGSDGLQLVLDGTTLPALTLSAGAIAME